MNQNLLGFRRCTKKVLQSFAAMTILFSPTAALADPPGSGWKQVFSDDFNGSSLDTSKWSPCFYWADSSGCTNGGAGDLQWFSPDDVLVGNGMVRLRAQKRSMNGHNYTSGMIASHDKFSFQYGYAEFRAKVPKGNGFWPTFWLLAQDKSWPPEIDVAEFIGSNTNNAHLTLHYRSGGQHKSSTGWASGADYSAGYHTYAVEWAPDKIVWYVDGVESKRYTGEGIPQQSMYLTATLALGKAWSNYGPDGSTPFPGYVDIDYIKVWRR
jgi:beta-glucanase (GH16 family)